MQMINDESLEDEEKDVVADPPQMLTNEKLQHLTEAMKLLDLSKPSHASCNSVLCMLQHELRAAKTSQASQTTLYVFFQ